MSFNSNANFALPSLKNYRAFYRTYPEVGTQIAVYLLDRFGKGYTACSFLPAGALERLESKGYTPCSLLTAGGELQVALGRCVQLGGRRMWLGVI